MEFFLVSDLLILEKRVDLPSEILCGDNMSEILRTREFNYVFGQKVKRDLPYW